MKTPILCALAIGIPGLLLVLTAILIFTVQYTRQKHMTSEITGTICRHSYRGNGNIAPIISYTVDGKSYEVRRKFRYVIEKSVHSPMLTSQGSSAYVNEKDALVLHTRNITNYKAIMEDLWPIGKPIQVFYNPQKPKQACAEKFQHLPGILSIIYFWVGIGFLFIAILLGILLPPVL